MQRLQFEYSPFFILICIAVGWVYAYILYRSNYSWSKKVNRVLFALRLVVVSLIAFLFLGPILKLVSNQFEKPTVVFLIDNSTSIKAALDSAKRNEFVNQLSKVKSEMVKAGYEVVSQDIANNTIEKVNFNQPQSDIASAIKNVATSYEGKNLSRIVLISDGIYNMGASPIYNQSTIPISTMGIGDTTEHADVLVKDVVYNKVVYQGNKFPIRVEVLTQGFSNLDLKVQVSSNNRIVERQQKNTASNRLAQFEFLVEAKDKGIQRYDILVDPVKGELNRTNNRSTIFVEVVEGRKKILLVAPAPHPDIKAIRSVIEKNANYEFKFYIPGFSKIEQAWLKPENIELAIFHQMADRQGKTTPTLQLFQKSKASLFFILGAQSNLRQLQSLQIPLSFENNGQWDQVSPVVNASFRNFDFPDNVSGVFAKYPPIEVPFGKFKHPANVSVLLFQQIGSVVTDRPLLATWENENQKMAALLGEGIWQWRLNEFREVEKTETFDDTFLKLFQYLSTTNDKRKFKSFPTQSEFSEAASASIESQVYNDLYQPIYGNTISITLVNEQNESTNYQYVTSPGGTRYEIGGLKEGIYRFMATTDVNGKSEKASGQFLVRAQNIEMQNLTADFGLMKKLATSSGGEFFYPDQMDLMLTHLKSQRKNAIIHTDESFNPLINLKWFFFLLLMLISAEWFLRKYLGGY